VDPQQLLVDPPELLVDPQELLVDPDAGLRQRWSDTPTSARGEVRQAFGR